MMDSLLALIVLLLSVFIRSSFGQQGFISIDCGLTESSSYTNPTDKLTYVSDDGFVDSGVSMPIDPASNTNGLNKVYYTVRSFPNYTRNCYLLPATVGTKYIVRAAFMYGNYDGHMMSPSFDIYLGVDLWDTIKLDNASHVIRTELVVQAVARLLFVCLVRSGGGTPFISSLKLRPLSENIYAPANSSLSIALKTFMRIDVGAKNWTMYPDDRFDRIWSPDYDSYGAPYIASHPVEENSALPLFGVPSVVFQTAVYKPQIVVSWPGGIDSAFHIFFGIADVLRPDTGQKREMNIQMNGLDWGSAAVDYLSGNVLYSTSLLSASQYSFSIRSTNSSDKGAVLNSLEVYKALPLSGSNTDAGDVSAMGDIKGAYQLKKNWMADPCLPQRSPWEGLTCDNASIPRIVTLDISNSELNGTITGVISKLTALKTLNLSRNNLRGPVPTFLQELPNLLLIDLSSNNLSGSIPPGLQKRNDSGEILLRIDNNPLLCQGDQCNGDKKGMGTKIIIVISVVVSLVLVASLILFFGISIIKRRKQITDKLRPGMRLSENEENTDSLPRPRATMGNGKSGTFSYSQVVEMTDNFEKQIGKGGSGTVYYGRLKDGREVAVKRVATKLLERGAEEFAAEVKLLMQVHHKHLTPFVGYCDDEKEMILIYEYMPNGDLQHLLSDETTNVLKWPQRLRIALNSAMGLEYLHSGCSRTIIHRDVKSGNILLNENFEAKIADFGLSKSVISEDVTHITTAVAGTAGYLDPQYCFTSQVTEKSDVYGFGVVLFELITGQPAISTIGGQRVPIVKLVVPKLVRGDIKSIIDPRLQEQYEINSIWKVAEIAMACTGEKSIMRPTMTEVVKQLKEAMEIETSRERSGRLKIWASFTSTLSGGKTPLGAATQSDIDSSFYPSAR